MAKSSDRSGRQLHKRKRGAPQAPAPAPTPAPLSPTNKHNTRSRGRQTAAGPEAAPQVALEAVPEATPEPEPEAEAEAEAEAASASEPAVPAPAAPPARHGGKYVGLGERVEALHRDVRELQRGVDGLNDDIATGRQEMRDAATASRTEMAAMREQMRRWQDGLVVAHLLGLMVVPAAMYGIWVWVRGF